jgi:hypothetical protein
VTTTITTITQEDWNLKKVVQATRAMQVGSANSKKTMEVQENNANNIAMCEHKTNSNNNAKK